ncbi:MAG TPA: cupin domain-containing protein [Gaiellaceae bacterium]|jgi:mannose-6-phosphate isomerase-like protein (cupin superfamily)|nr:cupin domain-containing protein [Gaiellaceae bacterium]
MLRKVDLAEKLASFDEIFSPRIVGYYNDDKIQVAKVRGEFVWHAHPETDDLILVLAGRLVVETREEVVELGPGELVVVPRGVEHRTRAEEETHTLLVERRGTPNTGDAEATPAPEIEL